MKKPKDFELKKWIVSRIVSGLKIHYFQTGVDTAETDWELIDKDGKSKRVRAHRVKDLVSLTPDWVRVLRPIDLVVKEVEEWEKFAKKEKRDLAEYNRLKKKFELPS